MTHNDPPRDSIKKSVNQLSIILKNNDVNWCVNLVENQNRLPLLFGLVNGVEIG